MKPIIKWAGGKERELPYIMSHLPSKIDTYIEPFVGGGAAYFSINIENSIINDKSDELMMLYNYVKEGNIEFFKKLEEMKNNWLLLERIVTNHSDYLLELYQEYSETVNKNTSLNLKTLFSDKIYDFVIAHADEFNGLLTEHFNIKIDNFLNEIRKNLLSKIYRMNKIENKKGKMSDLNVLENFECAFKSAYYMHFRYLYNEREVLNISEEFFCAIFYFIREYCYASMFRYNSHGKFNVPYGGISYNKKDFGKKIEYLKSEELKAYLRTTKLYNNDFEDFCKLIKPKKDDFIFLDPPYDTEFSTYAKNEFGKNDQIRLAEYLKSTEANFMLIIKNTPFIYDLYNVSEFNINKFEKKYLVSFQNRNDKDVEHLVITNY